MNTAAVTIPIYKAELTRDEVISLKQCFKILHNHPIIFFAPKSLDVANYRQFGNANFEFFEDIYFQGIDGYNRLMLDVSFYKRFSQYKFILIYQLDAFVFKDELLYWCNKNYDYIGAPWFENWGRCTTNSKYFGIGNGGFSLRKTSKSIEVLKKINLVRRFEKLKKRKKFNYILSNKKFSFVEKLLFKLLKIKAKSSYLNKIYDYGSLNEDFIWGKLTTTTFKNFKLPNFNDGIKFSFETLPSHLYKLNNSKLPFGCHAWRHYEFEEFWHRYIKTNDYFK